MHKLRTKLFKKIKQEQCRRKKDLKQEHRPNNRLKKPEKEKKGFEEAGAEQREEKVSDFLLELAYFALRDKLQHRDFIGESGFSRLISPFQEVNEKKGWHQLLGDHKAPGFVALAKEFYANMVGVKGKTMFFKGKWISFSRDTINETFNLKVQRWVKIQETIKIVRVSKYCGLANRHKRKMEGNKENPT